MGSRPWYADDRVLEVLHDGEHDRRHSRSTAGGDRDVEPFSLVEEVVNAWPDEAFERLGIDRATYIAILTHDPKLDDAALQIAIRSDAAYVGAMGSRRAQERRRERLLEAGMDPQELDRVAAPIGLDLGAISPEETALSILAEVVAVRHGRQGGRLSASTAPRIHEIEA